MYCNPKNKCNHLTIKPGNTLHGRPTGFCELANVSLDINVHPDKPHPDKPHIVFFKRLPNCNHFSTTAIPPVPPNKCCSVGEHKCKHLHEAVGSGPRTASCSKYAKVIRFDEILNKFVSHPDCTGMIMMNEPPGNPSPVCDICKTFITSNQTKIWPDGKFYHDLCKTGQLNHYCIDGGECYYLDISSEVEPLSNDHKAMCSRHKQQLTYDPMMMNFIPSPQCKAIVNKNEPPAMQEQTCRERFFQDFPKHDKSIDDHLNSPKASPSTDEVMSHNVGDSNYAKKKIQPWHIWEEYLLNAWDADIVKRILRDKESQSRRADYEKIIHICQKRISQIDDKVEGLS